MTDTIRSYKLNFHPMPQGVRVTCERYIVGFPVCHGSPSDVFAARNSFIQLYMLRFKEKEKRGRCWQRQLHTRSGSSLLADLNFQSVSGLFKNFTRMSPSEFEFLINLIREKIFKKDTAFRKAISVQERLALMHSSTGMFISFPCSSHASCFLILLKCIGCFGSHIIYFLL